MKAIELAAIRLVQANRQAEARKRLQEDAAATQA